MSRVKAYVSGISWCLLLATALSFVSCGQKPGEPSLSESRPATPTGAVDDNLKKHGTVEVTAKLSDIPEGAIFKRELYDYATVLKYEIVKVHRGEVKGSVIYVAQYNPFKARAEAADGRVKEIGGNLKEFKTGQVHHMALQVPVEDFFMGGIVNKYFGQMNDPVYWAVWTNLE